MLMLKMIDHLTRRGTQRVVGDVLNENMAMRDLIRSHEFEVDSAQSGGDTLRYVRQLAPARENSR